jgi:hypothetical protein
VRGGEYGLIIAADTANVSALGHISTYPSEHVTTAFQMPTANGAVPKHVVLHNGACKAQEQNLDG